MNIHLFTFLICFIIIFFILCVEGEAKICQKRSKTWSGPCFNTGNCKRHCINVEHATFGACHLHGFGFACYCYKKCVPNRILLTLQLLYFNTLKFNTNIQLFILSISFSITSRTYHIILSLFISRYNIGLGVYQPFPFSLTLFFKTVIKIIHTTSLLHHLDFSLSCPSLILICGTN